MFSAISFIRCTWGWLAGRVLVEYSGRYVFVPMGRRGLVGCRGVEGAGGYQVAWVRVKPLTVLLALRQKRKAAWRHWEVGEGEGGMFSALSAQLLLLYLFLLCFASFTHAVTRCEHRRLRRQQLKRFQEFSSAKTRGEKERPYTNCLGL